MCQRASLRVSLNPVEVERCFAHGSHVALVPREHTFCALMWAWIWPVSQLLHDTSGVLHRLQEDFVAMLSCRDYDSFLRAFQTPPGMYFMCKLDFLFWFRCLLDRGYACYSNLSLLELADDCINSLVPGVHRVFAVSFWSIFGFMLLHKCDFITIDCVKICYIVIKFLATLVCFLDRSTFSVPFILL